jgi:hypothetical protein
MPEVQDILGISFDWKKTQSDVDKTILEIDRLINAAGKVGATFSNINIAGGFAASKNAAAQSAAAINTVTQAVNSYSKSVNQSAAQTVADAKAKEEARFAAAKMNKELKATVELENTEANSIARARAELKGLNLLRNNVNVATAEGREQLIKLNAEIDRNNKFIKENADAALKQKLNIGNYESAFNGLAAGAKGIADSLLGAIGITAGLTGIISFFSDSIDEANQAEKATSRFRNALSNIGRTDVFERLSNKANDFVNTFKYLDNDDITEVFQQLISYGKLTEKQITDLTPVIINFAAKTGMSLNDSASTLIKALEGNGKALKEYGIDIKEGTTVTERLGIVMTDLKDKVAGAGQAFSETFAGRAAIARQEINNLKEDIGTKLLPILASMYSFTSQALTGLSKFFNLTSKVFTQGINGAAAFAAEAGLEAYSKEIESISKDAINSGKGIEFLQGKVASFEKQLSVAKANNDKDFIQRLRINIDGYNKAIESLKAEGANQGDDKILGLGDPDKIKESTKKVKEVRDYIAELRKELATIANLEAISQITPKDADIDRVKAYDKAFKGLFDQGLNADNGKVVGLGMELSPISIRVLEREITEEVNKLNNSTKVDILQAPAEVKKAMQDETKAYETELTRRQRMQSIAFANAQKDLLVEYALGKVNRKQYEEQLLDIQELYSEKSIELQIEEYEGMLKYAFIGVEQTQDVADKKYEIEKKLAELRIALGQQIKKADDRDYDERKQKLAKFVNEVQDGFNRVADLLGGVVNISVTKEKNALQEIEDTRQKNHENEVARINASGLSEEEKANRLKTLDATRNAQKEEFDRKTREADRKKAAFDKQVAIMNIILNTAAAVIKSLPNVPLSIAVGLLGAAQLAVAIATPLPKYAKGLKNNPKEHYGIFGEAGDELVEIPGQKPFIATQETIGFLPRGTNITPMSKDQLNDVMYRSMLRQTSSMLAPKDKGNDDLLRSLGRMERALSKKQAIKNVIIMHVPFSESSYIQKNVRGRG